MNHTTAINSCNKSALWALSFSAPWGEDELEQYGNWVALFPQPSLDRLSPVTEQSTLCCPCHNLYFVFLKVFTPCLQFQKKVRTLNFAFT